MFFEVVLWLEHIDDKRPERLRGFYHVGPTRITLAGDAEIGGRAVDRHSTLDECVDELGCGREVRLIRREDVPPGIAVCWIV